MSQEVKTTPVIKLSDVQKMVAEGVDRKEIAKHYGVSQAALKRTVFKHPSLRNKKALGTSRFEFIDDTDPENPVSTAAAPAPRAEAAATETQAAPALQEQAAPAQETAAAPAEQAAPVADNAGQSTMAADDQAWR